jgi:three-Cys-motif partner protein
VSINGFVRLLSYPNEKKLMMKTDYDWVNEHFGKLIKQGEEIRRCDATLECKIEDYEKNGHWPAMKLMTLECYITPYLRILGNQGKKMAYIDLFAGPGLNVLGEYKTPIPGSPLIPMCFNESEFDFSLFVLCEISDGRADSLEKRIGMINSHHDMVRLERIDANNLIQDLPEILTENKIDHSLIFIDPEGCEFSWSSMETLVTKLGTKCDLIINFPSSGIPRLVDCPQKLIDFLGPGSENMPKETSKIHDWAISIYRKNLESIGLNISTEIKVAGRGPYHYHLIPAVRKTRGGSPWFRIFDGVKKRVERLDSSSLSCMADCLEGRQDSLKALME